MTPGGPADARQRASRRAVMPPGTETLLDERSLAEDHAALARLLRPGLTVLDIGCGTGAITRGIADSVAPGGNVLGVDVNADLIARASAASGGRANLRFAVADIRVAPWDGAFDIVTAARVLQWLADPARAVAAMARATRPGGKVVVLDYDHTQASWEPPVPAAAARFYQAFLDWRAEAGMANAIAAQLPGLFHQAGLTNITATSQQEVALAGQSGFARRIALWPTVIATRGHQIVADGMLSEADRALAETELRRWVRQNARRQTLHLSSVVGTKPAPPA